jgi:hypothetical protein
MKNTFFVVNILITPHPPCRAPSPLSGRSNYSASTYLTNNMIYYLTQTTIFVLSLGGGLHLEGI